MKKSAVPIFHLLALSILLHQVVPAWAQVQPSWAVRKLALKSLVRIVAECQEGTRAGSGFALETPDRIVTAHHVVGGCSNIRVSYEGAPQGTAPREATVTRVLAKRDLAMLSVRDAPTVPVLNLAPPPPNEANGHSGFGYQNSQVSGSDLPVYFSVGSARLDEILTPQLQLELSRLSSPIDITQAVLRFNMALQPGMSGGPIVDANGAVVGIVAGGLKAGAAPASWGWPATWIAILKQSPDAVGQTIRNGKAHYSLADLQSAQNGTNSGRRIRCGTLDMQFRGTQSFQNLLPGADDYARVRHIMNISTMSVAELGGLNFDIWTHEASGATAVFPNGYVVSVENGVCGVATADNQFRQLTWGGQAQTAEQIQQISSYFETQLLMPQMPNFGYSFDPALTTVSPTGIPSANFRANGLVFNRKGIIHPKSVYQGLQTPYMHAFETLIARSSAFLGVVTINDEVTSDLPRCLRIGMQDTSCSDTREHVRTWTHFVLATQLSTFPAN